MAKLTVYFKFKEIDSYLFSDKVVHVGRDDTNDIQIDSLAVAPAHAAIILRDQSATIKQLNENFPLVVNGQATNECKLENGDTITLGKHDLVYQELPEQSEASESENILLDQNLPPHSNFDDQFDEHEIPNASLQVLDGPNIGKIVTLKKAMTRLGNEHSGIVVISRRRDGFFVTAFKDNGDICVNNQPIKDSYVKLKKNDILSINNVSLQFFLD